ncbi:MAG: DUF2854 domain-containing protein [Pseudanabaenaceae cyanobacterium bins.68]|nr:DUF2854 domain-containing protein [Pseudanabaenaceae cyanobacterium bins.68]
MLRQFSLGTIGLAVGGVMSIAGIYAYTIGNSTVNLVGFFYGIPILLGGLALKSSEVKPVAELFPPTKEILQLRESQATATQKQVRSDVCRYRYGIRAHLDEVLAKLGLSPTDEECPKLVGIYELAAGSLSQSYSLVLRFQAPLIPWHTWLEKQDKFTSFFGPGIIATVAQPEADTAPSLVDLHLTRVETADPVA